jgi:hypothetical protein
MHRKAHANGKCQAIKDHMMLTGIWLVQVNPVDANTIVRIAHATSDESTHDSHLAAAAAVSWDPKQPLYFGYIQQLQVAVHAHAFHNRTTMK